ncbi:MAG: hypothetical protein M3308_00340, partial [Actinomycetota bacterium]|nr:hypothetical protein [Actinomycetota bacterium]
MRLPVSAGVVPVVGMSLLGVDLSGLLVLTTSDEVGAGACDGVVEVSGSGASGAGSGACSPVKTLGSVGVSPPLSACPVPLSRPVMTV